MESTGTIRNCTLHDVDGIRVMCKDVYGGGDYMPRMITDYLSDPACLLLVHEGNSGKVDSIACAQSRGSMLFLFGLRVCPTARQKGLGRLLMDALLKEAQQRFPETCVAASTTACSNEAAQKILGTLLGPPLPTLDIWPSAGRTHHLSEYERSIGWPERQAGSGTPSILEFLEGAMDILRGDKEAMDILPMWTPSSSTAEAQQALVSLRCHSGSQAATGHGGSEQQDATANATSSWLPCFYEVWPAQSHVAAAAVKEQRLWILRGSSDSSSEAPVLGVMMLSMSPEFRRWIASIVAASPPVVHSALLLAAQVQPHFIGVIDRLQGKDDSKQPPAVYSTTGGIVSDCLPYLKLL